MGFETCIFGIFVFVIFGQNWYFGPLWAWLQETFWCNVSESDSFYWAAWSVHQIINWAFKHVYLGNILSKNILHCGQPQIHMHVDYNCNSLGTPNYKTLSSVETWVGQFKVFFLCVNEFWGISRWFYSVKFLRSLNLFLLHYQYLFWKSEIYCDELKYWLLILLVNSEYKSTRARL